MSDDQLPEDVDVVILGTGLPESILAGACARSGLSVLHLDRNDYYGGAWASFNLKTIGDWIRKNFSNGLSTTVSSDNPRTTEVSSLIRDGEEYVRAKRYQTVQNVSLYSNLRLDDIPNGDVSESNDSERNEIKDWRKFSLDLLPKILLSRDDMVKLLCDSTVARYCEFKCIDRFISFTGDDLTLEVVPCSRSEIFQCETISVLEKRRVMRFLQNCIDWRKDPESVEGWQQYADQPFDAYLESYEITGKLKHFVRDTLGILHPNANTVQGLDAVCKFLESAGCFGDSPFLWTLFGSGELPQCFCRLCAVFGGVYSLNREIDGFILREGNIEAVVTQGQRINCKQVIADGSYLPENVGVHRNEEVVHRAVLITDGSIVNDPEKEHLSALNLVAMNAEICPRLLEVGYEGCVAPKDTFVVHVTARGVGESKAALSPLIDRLYSLQENEQSKTRQLWSLYFDITQFSFEETALPQNLHIVPCPDADFCYKAVVNKTRDIFTKVWPDVDFLPPALPTDEQNEAGEQLDGSHVDEMRAETNGCPEADINNCTETASTEA